MNNYKQKKMKNQDLIKFIINHVSDKNLENIWNCGTFLNFFATEDLEKKKINKSNFCKNRFCPMCSWRQAKKDALKISILLKYIKAEFGLEFIFLTLTAPNVKGAELNDEIKRYNKAFSRLMKRKEVSKIAKGTVRKLEVTYNQERDDYHPHFHVMIAVNKSYFKKKDYISKKKWLELWQEAMQDTSITQVDIRRMDTDDKGSICEIAKYGAKDADYMVSQEVFDTFYKALKGKQLITYSGAFKEALKLFNDGTLDKYKELDLNKYVYELCYQWGNKEYALMEKRELTDEERRKINKALIEEMEVE